ncbi:hypothetical protein ZTR_08102 [Talaromyces verruculosus]|nr:hypothetical protein ZTR_08102 [Talaromyces verruculosus]
MGLIHLPTELILLILPPLSERDLAHLLQVHWSLYDIILPYLYRRHLQGSRNRTENGRNEANGFFRCIVTGNIAGVQHFLTYGADVNEVVSAAEIRKANIRSTGFMFIPWHDTQTPLNIAANMGNDALVSLLLNHGASVMGSRNHQDARRTVQPAVVDALLSNHESTLRLLLRHASPLSAPNMERGGLLNCAIARGNLSLLRMLVNEFGADLNATWQEGVYPLNRAVGSSGPEAAEIVRFILDKGADVALANGSGSNSNGDEESTGGGGQRLLNQAIRHGTIDTLRLLLDRGVVDPATQPLDNNIFRTWIIERCTSETVHLLHEYGYFRALDSSQDNTLMIAVRARRGDILQLFIDNGVAVDLNARLTRGGSTLLHTAVVRCKPVREAQAASSIRCTTMTPPVASSDVPIVRKIEREYSSQVLSRRCMSEKVEKCAPEEIVRCLVRGGADVNTKDAMGISPLDLAEKGPEGVYRILVDSRCE